MHELIIEDDAGESVDSVLFCSDPCHRSWCEANSHEYGGWSGCHETEFTDWCVQCVVVLAGAGEDDDAQPCEHQNMNVVVNRFLSEDGEKCSHGNWIQLPANLLAP